MMRKSAARGQRARCSRASRSRGGDGRGLGAELGVEDALDHGEHVGGAEDDAGGGEHGPEDVVRGERGLHGAGEDQELADEAREHGQAGGGEAR